jgi:protein-S-isoprenylcysteine O-methyltransferase Ste14
MNSLEFRNTAIESFLKSRVFSLLLCLFWGYFTFIQIQTLLERFDLTELLWLIYNVIISFLFLIRVSPSVVSMNIIHWAVALITSFSGFFFEQGADCRPILSLSADILISFAILLGIMTAIVLERSYDFLPALRLVKTKYVYQVVRHPMYASSIIIKLGYALKNFSMYNSVLLAIIIVLYDKRARYEEDIMSNDNSYVEYLQQVKYRFVPGIY